MAISMDRSLWAGGAAGVAVAILTWAAKKFLGWDIDPALASSILLFISGLVASIVPPSVKDIIKQVDDTVIAIARASENSPASEKAPAMTAAVAKAVNEATAGEGIKI